MSYHVIYTVNIRYWTAIVLSLRTKTCYRFQSGWNARCWSSGAVVAHDTAGSPVLLFLLRNVLRCCLTSDCGRSAVQNSDQVTRKRETFRMGALTPVDKCCCGCSLKTGSIVIGTLSAVNGAVSLLVILQSSVNPHISEYVNPYMLLGGALIALCQLITGFLLILGADKDCSKYVKPWLGFQCVKLLLDVISSCIAVYYISHATIPVTGIVVIITTMLLGLVLEGYLMLVVYSFYKKLVNVDAKLPL